VGYKFGTKEPTRIVISRELVIKRLSYVFGAEAIFWRLHVNKDDLEVETFVRGSPITEDTD